jgi:predicted nucleic acid-binding protein
MLAIDTNVVVRYITRDHPEQSPRAKALIDGNDVFVPTTVLLEADWVLRSTSRFARSEVVEALRSFAGLPRVILEDAGLLATALGWAAGGMDFADALHLARSSHCEAFISFDRRLGRTAKAVGAPAVRTP